MSDPTTFNEAPCQIHKTPKLGRLTFHTSRLLDFASEKELVAQTGHRLDDWPLVIAKELLDNCLDACEEEAIAPEIRVGVDRDGITVADNGPGLPASTLDGVLDFSVRTSSRLGYIGPTRGAQGNALKTVLMMPFVLSGDERRGRVDIGCNGDLHQIAVTVDQIRQEPVLTREAHPDETCKKGTSVRIYWPSGRRPLLVEAGERILQVLSDFAWLNPHLSLCASVLGAVREFKATDPAWRKWLPRDPTSAHWYKPNARE